MRHNISLFRTCTVQWSGPWQEVETDIKLYDISISMESIQDDIHAVWAVSNKGDVMVRNDVTASSPQASANFESLDFGTH